MTEAAIISMGHEMVQTGGYGCLNYGQIASELGITRAAVHYYFPNKRDLAGRIINEYRAWTRLQLEEISAESLTTEDALAAYIRLYRDILQQGDQRMCPGGMLASEAVLLPESLRSDVKAFFDDHMDWASKLFINDGWDVPAARHRAMQVVSALQGALLLSRLYERAENFDESVESLVSSLVGE